MRRYRASTTISSLKRFWSDAGGAVLMYITATLPALIGFALLAVDASRLLTLHTTLQKGVDALALAGAGELDRLPGAMARANVAIANLVQNKQMFGEGSLDIDETNVTVRFFSSIPASDATPMPTSGSTVLDPNVASDDFVARFIEVTVNTYSLNTIFPATFVGGADGASTNATAVAGNDQAVCHLAPLFICNPWEPSSNTDVRDTASIINNTNTRKKRRRQILMRMGPGGSSYGPGNYGFLDMGNGATALERALAIGRPETCFVQNGVDTKTGQNTGPVEDGINVRFGIYPPSLPQGITSPYNTNWAVRPAKNVRMAQTQGGSDVCRRYTPDVAANSLPLPRDGCFASQSCTWIGGDTWGTTEMTPYWTANFGTSTLPLSTVVAPAIVEPAYQTEAAAVDWTHVTRYDIYKYEIAQSLTQTASNGSEYGDPKLGSACWQGSDLSSDTVDRRLITGAILNCQALAKPPYNNNLNGNQVGVPVAAFAEFFITEPLEQGGSGTAGDIFSEFVNLIVPGSSNSTALDQVQLYR